MSEITRATVVVDPALVQLVGTGGVGRERALYVDGKRQDAPMKTSGGATIRRLSGLAVSVGGVGYDGADVESTTPLEAVDAGVIYRAEGHCEVRFRAEGRAGFGDGGPRGVLRTTLFVERVTPVGSIADVLSSVGAGGRSK
ncbi:hypothetical protein GCM10027169_22970 [Gordonia jinhuaensis]|uniref:Uncharacterized protein n=1 Tax=Gordonia jinhuaensis TaxID=1517702 RepID=A0A916TF26_9ACTN|nr:hypothetical protein [Gordonia jinhuaensis]GGB41536.1 hypothetical protein GCM10011489_31420 [Gordonia jinhuaensis]